MPYDANGNWYETIPTYNPNPDLNKQKYTQPGLALNTTGYTPQSLNMPGYTIPTSAYTNPSQQVKYTPTGPVPVNQISPTVPTLATKTLVPETTTIPTLGTMPTFDQQKLQQITNLLYTTGMTPEEQQAIDITKQIGGESTAQAIARAQTGAQQRGMTGSTIEQFGLAQAGAQGQLATQQAISPILQNIAARKENARAQLASLITDIGKMDVENQRQAIFKTADLAISTGQFNAGQINTLRKTGAELVQREIENLRAKGIDEARLAQEYTLRMTELDRQTERLQMQIDADTKLKQLDAQIAQAKTNDERTYLQKQRQQIENALRSLRGAGEQTPDESTLTAIKMMLGIPIPTFQQGKSGWEEMHMSTPTVGIETGLHSEKVG